jgi:hypothetical protein
MDIAHGVSEKGMGLMFIPWRAGDAGDDDAISRY